MTTEIIKISAPKIMKATFGIRGTAPLMTARFSKKAELMAGMADPTQKNRKVRKARDFNKDAEDASYRSVEGWYGVSASAFRNASISACRLVGFKMTLAKLSIFIVADGYDRDEGMPLVRIIADSPTTSVMHVRNATGVIDMRARPMWAPGWEAKVTINWDDDQFKLIDITNLLSRVGAQVGIGEGRPDSRESAGLGYGLFEILDVTR